MVKGWWGGCRRSRRQTARHLDSRKGKEPGRAGLGDQSGAAVNRLLESAQQQVDGPTLRGFEADRPLLRGPYTVEGNRVVEWQRDAANRHDGGEQQRLQPDTQRTRHRSRR